MRLLAFIGALALVAAAALAGYLSGGYYNVAATAEDPGPVDWALVRIRQASIARHASASPPFTLTEPARIQDGARAFAQRGCVNCHGAPGASWAKFSEGLKPSPPDLKEIAPQAEPGQVFWVIKNGIRMTAMPSFGAIEVPDLVHGRLHQGASLGHGRAVQSLDGLGQFRGLRQALTACPLFPDPSEIADVEAGPSETTDSQGGRRRARAALYLGHGRAACGSHPLH